MHPSPCHPSICSPWAGLLKLLNILRLPTAQMDFKDSSVPLTHTRTDWTHSHSSQSICLTVFSHLRGENLKMWERKVSEDKVWSFRFEFDFQQVWWVKPQLTVSKSICCCLFAPNLSAKYFSWIQNKSKKQLFLHLDSKPLLHGC